MISEDVNADTGRPNCCRRTPEKRCDYPTCVCGRPDNPGVEAAAIPTGIMLLMRERAASDLAAAFWPATVQTQAG